MQRHEVVGIEVRDLVRVHGRGDRARRAVDGISFDVARGEFSGILGPNGAGRTTTIKMMLTTLLPGTQAGPRGVKRSVKVPRMPQPRTPRRDACSGSRLVHGGGAATEGPLMCIPERLTLPRSAMDRPHYAIGV
ncbi:ATP-binding cassette domain-containing protein [Micromonospora coerulea]|uniref:ATP-binding cassette domain-containing protein n=1 Tax=Micromonospora coerulea TaxID=47856 RepID=UPI0027DABE53|nr:ATP-binding cassette domain-containing protein [Micromonospora veneta]